MQELHNTVMGRRLIEHDIPEIHKQLKRIADALEGLVKKEAEKKEKVLKVMHGLKSIKKKPGEYEIHFKGDRWRVHRDGVGNIYWWYAEMIGNNSHPAFRGDSKNAVLEKLKASYNVTV